MLHERVLDAIDQEAAEYERYAAEHRDQEIVKVEAQHKAGQITKAQRDEMVKALRLTKMEAVKDYYRFLEDQYSAINY
jgi:phospholipid N-methyltransferase